MTNVQRARDLADGCLFAAVDAPKMPPGHRPANLDRATQGELTQLVYGELCKEGSVADSVSVPLWEALCATLSAVQRQRKGKSWLRDGDASLKPESDLYILNYLTSMMLLIRRPLCFLQPPRSATENPPAEEPSVASGTWLEKLPEPLKKQGRELASVVRFVSTTASAEELLGVDQTAANSGVTQWINQRNTAIETVTSILDTASLSDGAGKPVEKPAPGAAVPPARLCFTESTPQRTGDTAIPLVVLRETFCALVVLSRYFKAEASEEQYTKLESAARGFQDRCQTSTRVMTSFARRVRRESTAANTHGFQLKDPQSWAQLVPQSLEKVLLQDVETLRATRSKSLDSFVQASGMASYVHPWLRNQNKAEDELALPNGHGGDEDEDEAPEKMVWETAEDAPATVALDDLRTMFFSTIPMEMQFNDGVSNSLRDLDQVVKILRLLSRAPSDLSGKEFAAGNQDSFAHGVPQKVLDHLLFCRDATPCSAPAGEAGAGVASSRGKRGRDVEQPKDDKDEASSSSVPTKQQPRVLLPVKAGVDGSYKTDGVVPPLEATWTTHCKISE